MKIPNYLATFGIDPKRIQRGAVLAGILDLELGQIPRFRDGWVEKRQNPDAAPGVGPLVIAFYTESNGSFRDGAASKIFTMRAHPMYREERDDVTVPIYTTFFMNVPADLPADVLHALVHSAVDPVDTDLRWQIALGVTPLRKGTS